MDILCAAQRYHMLQPGDLVVAAVSGGPDSVAMLHALHTCSEALGISLHVGHLNHGIRGEQSNIDQEFVSELAHSLGIPATIGHVDVPELRLQMRMGEEEAARELRYKFLQKTCTNLGASKIAVAHNADDRAESVLLNVIRGSGIAGLGSIRPVRGNIIRPLIDTTRQQIMSYVEQFSLPFRVDESNTDISYSRNRIRHELLPLLAANYNPRIIESLVRLADIALPEDDYAGQAAASAVHSLQMRAGLDSGLLAELPLAIQRRVLRSEIQRHKGNLLDVSLEQIDRVLGALASGSDFTITLPSGRIFAERKGCEVRIRPAELAVEEASFEYTLSVPGATPVPEANLAIHASVHADAAATKLPSHQLLIDSRAVSGALHVRSHRPGDRMIPFGMHGTKKLQDIFVDKKIDRRDRSRVAIVEDDEKIIWVAGVVASEAARIVGTAEQAICLEVRPLSQ